MPLLDHFWHAHVASNTGVPRNTHTHIHTYTLTHTNTHTHTHIHTHTHTHTHTYTHNNSHINTFSMGHFPYFSSANFKICFRPNAAIVCKCCKGYHLNGAHIPKNIDPSSYVPSPEVPKMGGL